MSDQEKSIRLTAVGDLALGGALEDHADRFLSGSTEILSRLRESDLVFGDLDCTFDTQGTPPNPDEYLVSASAGQLRLLEEMNIHVVSQANNHSLDFGAGSLATTRSELERRGIKAVGAGTDLASAREPVVIRRGGLTIGFLAYASTHPWVGAVAATSAGAGVAPLDAELIEPDVKALAAAVDCVVVSLHWGKEYIHYPPPSHIDLARDIVTWGGRLVIGHHPHVIQGVEEHGRGVICYSLGNFLFPDYGDQHLAFAAECRESLLLTFEVRPESVRVAQVTPVVMSDECVLREACGAARRLFHDRFEQYSRQLHEPGYDRLWATQIRAQELRRLRRVLKAEVLDAGWRSGLARLSSLGFKNIRSIGRSLREIVGGRDEGSK